MTQQLNDLLVTLPDWAIRLILAFSTIIIFLVMRRFILRIIENGIHRFLLRFGWAQIDAIVDVVLIPVRFLVIAGAIAVGLQILKPDPATNHFANNLIRSLLYVAVFVALFRFVDMLTLKERPLRAILGFWIEDQLLPILRTIIKLILYILATIMVMQEWSIDVSGLLASLGIVGLAFSLAAQDTVSNLFGFSTIIGDRPFLVGEYIRSGTLEGVVEKVGVRSTRIRKPDRGLITVPNNLLVTNPVERFLHRRIQFTLGVTYQTTADQMETLVARLREMLSQRDNVIDNTVAVYFTEFGDSSLDIMVLCEVRIRDWHALMNEREQVNLSVMRLVREMGLSIAFPTRSIYIDSLPRNQTLLPTQQE